MSTLTVNTIEPRTEAEVNFTGLNPPSYLGQELAIKAEVLALTGGTMTGFPVLPGNASANLQTVPLQQLNNGLASVVGSRSVGSFGFINFPGSLAVGPTLTLQWTSVTITDASIGTPGSVFTVTWPTPFLNACYTVQTTIHVVSGELNNLVAAITSMSTTGAGVQVQEWSAGTNPCTIHFLAIGY